MTDEYISKTKFEELMRKKARNNFDLYYADKSSKHYREKAIGYNMAATEAYDFPTADVQPVKHGRWMGIYEYCEKNGYVPSGMGIYYWCSECDKAEQKTSDFCPNCGARMDGNPE